MEDVEAVGDAGEEGEDGAAEWGVDAVIGIKDGDADEGGRQVGTQVLDGSGGRFAGEKQEQESDGKEELSKSCCGERSEVGLEVGRVACGKQGEDAAGKDFIGTVPGEDGDVGVGEDAEGGDGQRGEWKEDRPAAGKECGQQGEKEIELHFDAEAPELGVDRIEGEWREIAVEEEHGQVMRQGYGSQRQSEEQVEPGEGNNATEAADEEVGNGGSGKEGGGDEVAGEGEEHDHAEVGDARVEVEACGAKREQVSGEDADDADAAPAVEDGQMREGWPGCGRGLG